MRFFCREVNHDHVRMDETFASLSEAKTWIAQKQLDQVFTVERSHRSRIVYECRHHKARSHGMPLVLVFRDAGAIDKLPALNCKAVLRVDEMNVCVCQAQDTDEADEKSPLVWLEGAIRIRVRGCLGHSHPQEVRFLRMSQKTKEFLISLLKLGLTKETILSRYCNSTDIESQENKLVTLQDLSNLEQRYVNGGIDRNKSVIENMCVFLEQL